MKEFNDVKYILNEFPLSSHSLVPVANPASCVLSS